MFVVGICKLEDFSVGFRECHLICLISQWHLLIQLWRAETEWNKKPQYHTVTERYPSLGYKTQEEERESPPRLHMEEKVFGEWMGSWAFLKLPSRAVDFLEREPFLRWWWIKETQFSLSLQLPHEEEAVCSN